MSKKTEIIDIIINKLDKNKNFLKNLWLNPEKTKTNHFIIDDLLPKDICENIYDEFPRKDDIFFQRKSFREKKKTCAKLKGLSSILSDITYAFHDQRILNLITEITNINKLEPDKNLYAGGLSVMTEGDYLNPHIDNSHDMHRDKYRRLNLLYYVSKDWSYQDGGNLELWDENLRIPNVITSKFNRLVVMNTNKKSWHSVNKVLTKKRRCCVSNYYFSSEPPGMNNEYFHVTSFTGRPEEKIKKIIGFADNFSRNIISKTLRFGRGKKLINK
tara:strand:+ start:1720 stop:2535 length:816 start_codon:yes stop_codon:yes gene_type:complete